MKKLKLNFLVLLIISIFMVACRSESFITEENTEISIPKTGEYILKEAPLFKQFLLNNVTNKASTNKNNVVLNDDRPVFIVYKENAVSYSTIVKNVNESSFNVWVYTIGEDKETFFSAEYIPKSPIINNDLNHFTGTVNYRSIDGSLLGTIKFINGEPKNKSTMTVTGENGKVSSCSLLIISTPVSCTSPEHHMPWDTCYETGSNRPYYETEIHKICTESQFPNIGLDGGGGYGGGGGNSSGSEPAAEISIQDVFNMQLMQSNYPELTPEQYSYIENNQYIGGQILGYFGWNLTDNYHQLAMWCIDYLRENNNFNLSEYKAFKKIEDFINFGQQFFSDNPNTTWAEFENWFAMQNEGVDFFYDKNYWEDPNLIFPSQNLPSWSAFSAAYPNQSSSQLYGVVGGAVAQAQIDYPLETENGCALKVSRALNYSGVIIPNIPGKTLKGADNKYYFLNAKALNAWMRKTFGISPNNPNHYHFTKAQGGINGQNFPNLIKNKKGIFSMVSTTPQWASGHADILYPNGICKAGCHLYDIPPAPIDYVDIWILE